LNPFSFKSSIVSKFSFWYDELRLEFGGNYAY